MNKEKKEFSLIEGIFSPEEAKEVLTTLINDKIRFHDHKIFSHEERFGKVDAESIARKVQLQKTKENLLKYLQESVEQGAKLRIHSNIHILVNK